MRLISDTDRSGATDLYLRWLEVQSWFSGEAFYGAIHHGVYPPASYVMLWPLTGPFDFETSRWVMAAVLSVVLVWVVVIVRKQAQLDGYQTFGFAAFLATMSPVTLSIGNGQITLLSVLFILIAGTASPRFPLLIGAMLALALIKPNAAIPLVMAVLLARSSVRIWAATFSTYVALALVGSAFRDQAILPLHVEWLSYARSASVWGSSGGGADVREIGQTAYALGYGSINDLLGALELSQYNLAASATMLLLLAGWSLVYRSSGIWIVLGCAALVARFWTYHIGYDDMLVLFAIIACFIAARNSRLPVPLRNANAGAVAAMVSSLLVPSWFYIADEPVRTIYATVLSLAWLSGLGVLLITAEKLRRLGLSLPAGV